MLRDYVEQVHCTPSVKLRLQMCVRLPIYLDKLYRRRFILEGYACEGIAE